MTNLQEAKLSREAEICYATLALVTDFDCWHEEEDDVTIAAVLENLRANARLAAAILRRATVEMPERDPRAGAGGPRARDHHAADAIPARRRPDSRRSSAASRLRSGERAWPSSSSAPSPWTRSPLPSEPARTSSAARRLTSRLGVLLRGSAPGGGGREDFTEEHARPLAARGVDLSGLERAAGGPSAGRGVRRRPQRRPHPRHAAQRLRQLRAVLPRAGGARGCSSSPTSTPTCSGGSWSRWRIARSWPRHDGLLDLLEAPSPPPLLPRLRSC